MSDNNNNKIDIYSLVAPNNTEDYLCGEDEQIEYFTNERHRYITSLECKDENKYYWLLKSPSDWRLKGRMRTVSVLLVCCLNIGVDPPDIVKPQPCANVEAWIDPFSMPPQKALDSIGHSLKAQYERWQPRARYKTSLDPTMDDIKRITSSMRLVAKKERVLFHYNGHGVPKPSENGEIWVFNHNFTQYIPLSVYELSTWLKSPTIYVFDCASAGVVVESFNQMLQQNELEYQRIIASQKVNNNNQNSNHQNNNNNNNYRIPQAPSTKDCIILAACDIDEVLPVNPEFPADLFTACLTTPIKTALRWFASRSVLTNVTPEMIDKIPGTPTDRKSPLGELHWIFTAITDTIAWNILPEDLFQALFRADLLVASLFRNFLLADRIMRSLSCTPVSRPRLPATHKHPMWQAWDLAVEYFLSQLEKFLVSGTQFRQSSFFSDHLQAFEVWLEYGCEKSEAPMQLPIVLQVLLSQIHRVRALVSLARFLDKGSWAVDLALKVGIFPYVLKLLQSSAIDLREVLVFIWTKILTYDPSCRNDLVKDKYQQYFVTHFASPKVASPRQRIMSAYILAVIARQNRPGQKAVYRSGIIRVFVKYARNNNDALLRRWICLCLGVLWEKFEEAKWFAVNQGVHDLVCDLLKDENPDVRASAVFALGKLMGGSTDEKRLFIELEIGRRMAKYCTVDASAIVRYEMIIAVAELVYSQRERFLRIALEKTNTDEHNILQSPVLKPFTSSQQTPPLIPVSSQQTPPLIPTQPGMQRATSDMTYRRRKNMNEPSPISPVMTPVKMAVPVTPVPETPVNTAMNGVTDDDSYPTTHRNDNSLMESPEFRSSPEYQCRILYKVILHSCNDPFPCVSKAALAIKRHLQAMKFPGMGGSASVSKNSPSGHDNSPMTELDLDNSDLQPTAAKAVRRSSGVMMPGNPYTHFNRHKLANLRHKDVDQPKLKRTTRKDELSHLEKDSDPFNEDPRTTDPTWRVPESSLFDLAAHYFSISRMGTPYSNESIDNVLTKCWRYRRNKKMEIHANNLKTKVFVDQKEPSTFEQLAVFHSGFDQISNLVFHPYENILIAADGKDRIGVWDHKELEQRNVFANGNPRGTRIGTLQFINNLHVSMLLIGSDEGVVKIWKDVHEKKQQKLVESWVAIRNLPTRSKRRMKHRLSQPTPSKIRTTKEIITSPKVRTSSSDTINANKNDENDENSSSVNSSTAPLMVVSWQQTCGRVVAAGACNLLHLWDVEKCQKLQTIDAKNNSGITSIESSRDGSIIFAGYNDGMVRLFDIRENNPSIKARKHHKGRIIKVHVQRGGIDKGKLVSADITGDVYLSDIRMSDHSTSRIAAHHSRPLNSFAAHDYAPLLASGSYKQFIKVFDEEGGTLNVIKYHEGFLGQRVGPISSLAFHPHKLILASGALDAFISTHSCDEISSSLVNLSNNL